MWGCLSALPGSEGHRGLAELTAPALEGSGPPQSGPQAAPGVSGLRRDRLGPGASPSRLLPTPKPLILPTPRCPAHLDRRVHRRAHHHHALLHLRAHDYLHVHHRTQPLLVHHHVVVLVLPLCSRSRSCSCSCSARALGRGRDMSISHIQTIIESTVVATRKRNECTIRGAYGLYSMRVVDDGGWRRGPPLTPLRLPNPVTQPRGRGRYALCLADQRPIE